MNKRNVTISLDEATAQWARVEAARGDTSVSQFVGTLLREKMNLDAAYKRSMKSFLSRKPTRLSKKGEIYPHRDSLHDRASFR